MRIISGLIVLTLALAACSKDETAGTEAAQAQTQQQQPPQAAQQPIPAVSPPVATSQPAAPPAPDIAPVSQDGTMQGTILVKTNFVCKDGNYFTAQFENGPSQARIIFPKDPQQVLIQRYAASGFWYQSIAGYELRGKGQSARWTQPGREPVMCITYSKYSKPQ